MDNRRLLAVAALAGATLCLEGTLTRQLAAAQYYHFAFLVISLALLGFAASGTLLSLSTRLKQYPIDNLLAGSGIAFTASLALTYLAVNLVPFDSYAMAIDSRQIEYFALYYLTLSLPFLCSGTGIAAALSTAARGSERMSSNIVYAANLVGSAGGVLLAPVLISAAGVPGALCGCAILGAFPALLLRGSPSKSGRAKRGIALLIAASGLAALIWLGAANQTWRAPYGLVISPYKGLAYARLHPGFRLLLGRWNAISRLDMVEGAGVHAMPGLSYTYRGSLPPQIGLSIDGDNLSPVSLVEAGQFEAAGYLPEALAFELRPGAAALVIEPGGGLGLLQAHAGAAANITTVLHNRLVPQALEIGAPGSNPFEYQNIETIIQNGRSYLQRESQEFDLIYLPLTDSHRPVTSGAYSLQETYELTVEMFTQAFANLAPDGILVVTRWLQTPPSESVRMAATLVEALEATGKSRPKDALLAYRGIQTITFLVKPDGWDKLELAAAREFSERRRYDLVWAPDVAAEETNRFNHLPESFYYLAVRSLLASPDRDTFYEEFPFDVRPAIDDHPFFYHFFTWEQVPEIVAQMGRTWQPFGGSGFLVLLALLIMVSAFSLILVIVPLAVLPVRARLDHKPTQRMPLAMPPAVSSQTEFSRSGLGYVLAYFSLIGLAFLLVEIPLIQRWILLLGHPTYAFTAVVLSLLLFSGLGSSLARRPWLPKRAALISLAVLALLTPWMTGALIQFTLGWNALARGVAAVLILLPLGLLMGLPFPLGLDQMESQSPGWVPWAWAVNGCASVIAAVLAAILSLSTGFSTVMWVGAAAYACCVIIYIRWSRISPQPQLTVERG